MGFFLSALSVKRLLSAAAQDATARRRESALCFLGPAFQVPAEGGGSGGCYAKQKRSKAQALVST